MSSSRALRIAAFLRDALGIQRSWHADGRCSTYSLLYSVLLTEQEIEHEIVVWMLDRVPGEKFADHWAVTVDFPHVIDITYPQVSPGDLRMAVDARNDYPSHYRGPLRYPAAPLLAAGGEAIGRGDIGGYTAYRVFLDCIVPVMTTFDGGEYLRHITNAHKSR